MRFSVRYSRDIAQSAGHFPRLKFCDMCRITNWSHFKPSIMNEKFNFLIFKCLSIKITLQWFKIPFFSMENSFFLIYFHWQILKIQEHCVSHSRCLVWIVSSLILCKFPSVFSTLKLKLGHSFFQFTFRFKLVFLNVRLRLYFELFPDS